MNRILYLALAAMLGLLLSAACRPSATPEAVVGRTATPAVATNLPATPAATAAAATDLPATPAATPTSVPEESAVPAVTPTPPPPAEQTPAPTSKPTATLPAGGEANADVLHVRAVQSADGTWTFHVTVQHPDTGWEDYADGWDVVTPDGTALKPDPDSPFTRLLLHPHVGEQPFTRSQSGIAIPPDVTQVQVRAHDLVDGYGGREVLVDLTVPAGEDFEVERHP